MTYSWFDDMIQKETGSAVTKQPYAEMPKSLLSHEQNQRFIIANAEIGCLMRKLQSRKKADVAAREGILAQIENAKQRRDAIFSPQP